MGGLFYRKVNPGFGGTTWFIALFDEMRHVWGSYGLAFYYSLYRLGWWQPALLKKAGRVAHF